MTPLSMKTKFNTTFNENLLCARASRVVLGVENPPANEGDLGSIPGLGRFPAEGDVNPLQYSCLEKTMDRGGWWTTVHGVAKS